MCREIPLHQKKTETHVPIVPEVWFFHQAKSLSIPDSSAEVAVFLVLLSGFGLFLRCFSCNSTGTSHTNPSRCPWKKERNFRKLLETAKMDKSLHVSTFNSTKHIKVTLFAKQASPVSLDTLSNSLFLHFHLHFLQQVHHLTQASLGWNWSSSVQIPCLSNRIGPTGKSQRDQHEPP